MPVGVSFIAATWFKVAFVFRFVFWFFSLGDTTPENNWAREGYFVKVFLEGLFFLAGLRLVFIWNFLFVSLLSRYCLGIVSFFKANQATMHFKANRCIHQVVAFVSDAL